jgi:hypothetical protein
MALNSSKIKGGTPDRVEQPVIEPGVYPARIVQIIDLGLQAQRPYQGKDKAPANEIMLTYELVDSFMVDKDGKELTDKPRWISETLPLYDVSKADKAKCAHRYKALDPNNAFGGDFSQVADIPVNVSLVHNQVQDKLYVNVAAIAAMRIKDAEKCPALKNNIKLFDLDAPDIKTLQELPEWIQEKIQKNLNYNGSKLQNLLEGVQEKAAKVDVAVKEEAVAAAEEDDSKPWD